jgi:DNA-binding winged helix-turn-helix (wHTH) protein
MPDGSSRPNSSDAFIIQTDKRTWRVQPDLNRVTSLPGSPTQLEPRVMQVLTMLVQRDGKVVSRSEFLDEVWADTVVNDEALTRAVSELRKTFDDSAQSPCVIETIRGTGYRLVASVEWAEDAESAPSPEPNRSDQTSWYVRPTFVGAAIGASAFRGSLQTAAAWRSPGLATQGATSTST